MATAVPSRFAVLAIDDDDCKPKKNKKISTNNINNNDKNLTNKQLKNKNNKSNLQVQKTSAQPKKDDKKKSKPNKKKKSEKETQQWEQWKEKDSMSVEEAYKQQLHEALLLSKLAYEEQKENNLKKSPDDSGKKSTGSSKIKKAATMSLDEFNNLTANNDVIDESNSQEKTKESDVEFFDRIDKETKQELINNKQRDILKSRLNKLDDDISLAQLKVEVEKRDTEISELKSIIDKLKIELSQVKERNKKLCGILAVGEMKDKASVIAEVSKLQEIRDELTSEVTLLHAQLEQERSKTRASSADLKNTKNKKKTTNDTA
ncbi:G kinase-anchoring protein 1 [Microplitis demolitor]|uniref:G kinase-anchoring protein 1 n=1 Tax=Microplitis demolitor TaxID=69319 RepID=UPI0006D517D1|nr:G kinase-anchoring protein 1 [Microplitis demolitor]